MSKRVLAMALAILAFFIFVGSPFHQTAEAIAVVDDAVIAILIAALAAIGITFVTTGEYENLSDYVGSLFNDYVISSGYSESTILNGIDYGRNSLGQLLLNNRFVSLVSTFALYVKSRFSLQDNNTKIITSSGDYLGDLVITQLPETATYVDYYNRSYITDFEIERSNAKVYIVAKYESYQVVLLSMVDAQVKITYKQRINGQDNILDQTVVTLANGTGVLDSAYTYTTQIYNSVFGSNPTLANSPTWSPRTVSYYYASDIAYALNANDSIRHDEGTSIVTDVINTPLDDESYSPGDGAILDVGATWGSTLPEILSDDIPDAFSDSNIGKTTITYESEGEVADQVEEAAGEQISQEVNDYQTPGLQNVFPFCIPFDIYAFFECLAAEPEAPAFTWRFYIPGICDEEIEIDLAAFDSAARILRTMELLLFIVGLAFVTRDKFLRG